MSETQQQHRVGIHQLNKSIMSGKEWINDMEDNLSTLIQLVGYPGW